MKYTYRITVMDTQGRLVAYRIVASTLVAAIAAAQHAAGVTTDPVSTQNEGQIDLEA